MYKFHKLPCKIFKPVLLIFLIMLFTLPCSADTVFPSKLPQDVIDIFKNTCVNLMIDDDYVIFPSSEGQYTMISGDLIYLDGVITLDGSGQSYVITDNNSFYEYQVNDITDFSLEVGNYLIYSNLENYPSIIDMEVAYEFIEVIIIAIIGVGCFISSIFSFVLRRRGKRFNS